MKSTPGAQEAAEILADLYKLDPKSVDGIAKLIDEKTAAPDLLEKLEYLTRYPLAMSHNPGFAAECKDLIAKATGK